jgi:hypothetical protein
MLLPLRWKPAIFVPARVWGLIGHGPEHIERLASLGCEVVRHLALRDQEAAPALAGRPSIR